MGVALPFLELQSRAPVWEALSDFWLDTELVDFEFDYIARVISDSPYSITLQALETLSALGLDFTAPFCA
jgi:hypothetical protein